MQSSTNRFDQGGDIKHEEAEKKPKANTTKKKAMDGGRVPSANSTPAKQSLLNASTASTPTRQKSSVVPSSPSVIDSQNEEIIVTVETVHDALGSKNWKFRKAAYDLLAQLVHDAAQGGEAMNQIPSDEVLQSLDKLVPTMLKESNAGALDAALRFVLLYADYVDGACNSSQARSISEVLSSGPALASSRPSTSKLVNALYLKLMEVGRESVTSIHAVVESLLTLGLTSKKPKTVVNAVTLVLNAAYAFGAACLPLGEISSSASLMLQHANRSVREKGINILAEICRAVGSKDPLENVFVNMKVAQVSELDELLAKQPDPTPPSLVHRHQMGAFVPQGDALAALQAGAEAAAAESYASREAIDIIKKLKETEYVSKMKAPKWSEKVGALDILIDSGGSKPYKLLQPSNNVNYAGLISELKELLKHTHVAVKSKTMNALGMLAEGIGGQIFPHLRPLLLPIIILSKDRKLTTATNNCLDLFFGNVLSFDHLLEKECGLPSVMNEKVQKSQIIRKAGLAYLSRCLERLDTAGPRGALTVDSTKKITKLCLMKAKDSDDTVRKEAIAILIVLLNNQDPDVSNSTRLLTKDLESSNARLYKTLNSSKDQISSVTLIGSSEKTKISSSKRSSSRGPPRRSNIPKPTKSPTKTRSNSIKRISSSSKITKIGANTKSDIDIPGDETVVDVEEATSYLSSLDIPKWSNLEDEGGIVLGLKSSNWKFRKEAIDGLSEFSQSATVKSTADKYPESVLIFVKGHTKDFKESNFNIMKAIMSLHLDVFQLFELQERPMYIWITRKATSIAIEKIADKKFSSTAPILLTRLCELQNPAIVISLAIDAVESIKSPLQHEGLLSWMKLFCQDFGAKIIGKSTPKCVEWVVKVG